MLLNSCEIGEQILVNQSLMGSEHCLVSYNWKLENNWSRENLSIWEFTQFNYTNRHLTFCRPDCIFQLDIRGNTVWELKGHWIFLSPPVQLPDDRFIALAEGKSGRLELVLTTSDGAYIKSIKLPGSDANLPVVDEAGIVYLAIDGRLYSIDTMYF